MNASKARAWLLNVIFCLFLSKLAHCANGGFVTKLENAVDALHRKGFAHGDLRQRNILVDHDGQIKFIDFTTGARIRRRKLYPIDWSNEVLQMLRSMLGVKDTLNIRIDDKADRALLKHTVATAPVYHCH